jgi:N-acetylglucosaminyldiphosphoundecaprenol N-acetyl-beta-D-mannosaminyltransferase
LKAYLQPWFQALDDGRLIETEEQFIDVLANSHRARVQTVNLQHLYLAKSVPDALASLKAADFVTADGWPLVSAARRMGHTSCRRVTGKWLCKAVVDGRLVTDYVVLGSDPTACDNLRDHAERHGSERRMCLHGPTSEWDLGAIVDDLNRLAPRLILVALGAPKCERLATLLRASVRDSIIVGVGGGVEMATGRMPSAPELIERLNLEWLYRLTNEPRRMARRYLIECPPVAIELLTVRRDPQR